MGRDVEIWDTGTVSDFLMRLVVHWGVSGTGIDEVLCLIPTYPHHGRQGLVMG